MPPAADVLCDASVVLKWFHSDGEEEVEASRALLDLHRSHGMALSVLDLTAYEVGNALLRGIGVGAEKVSAVLDALDVIWPRSIAPSSKPALAVGRPRSWRAGRRAFSADMLRSTGRT